MKILITSGGTRVPIDAVRSITNMSSGTFGAQIATEALKDGHTITFFRHIHSKSPFTLNLDMANLGSRLTSYTDLQDTLNLWGDNSSRYTELGYDTYDDYAFKLKQLVKANNFDAILLAAAVSDFTVFNGNTTEKLCSNYQLNIQLTPTEKLIGKIKHFSPKSKLVGFKLLVNCSDQDLIDASRHSIRLNTCDMVVANSLNEIKRGHRVVLLVKPTTVQKFQARDNPNPNYLAKSVIDALKEL